MFLRKRAVFAKMLMKMAGGSTAAELGHNWNGGVRLQEISVH
jgi:hypothetical protein